MSRLVVVACLLMFVAVAICLDTPPKPNMDMPKDSQGHLPTVHPKHPDPKHKVDAQHQDPPRQDGEQMPKGDKSDVMPPQDTKN